MQLQGDWLTPEERGQAREHWDALMLGHSLLGWDAACLALKKASQPVQLAVMVAINRVWAQPVECRDDENPFTS